MYENEREVLELSDFCWNCLDILKDVLYASAYTFFWTDQMPLIQRGIRQIAPDIQGDWLRFRYNGKMITFSLSDEAIAGYRARIQEFVSFGAGVRMLGAYENYVRQVVDVAYRAVPEKMDEFERNHRKDIRHRASYIKSGVGRGIDFFSEVFDYCPPPSYRPSLLFVFELRNVAVHNSSVADQRLCATANNAYVNMGEGKRLQVGDRVGWNMDICLRLFDLLVNLVSGADECVFPNLGLSTRQEKAWWYALQSEDSRPTSR